MEEEESTTEQSGKGRGTALSLLIALIGMPLLAYAVTSWVLIPKMKAAVGLQLDVVTGDGEKDVDEKGEGEKGSDTWELNGVIINPADAGGARRVYLDLALKGSGKNFSKKMEQARVQLADGVRRLFSSKTVIELQALGTTDEDIAKDHIRTAINTALNEKLVESVYITQWAWD